MSTDDTNAARRGSGSNDLLGPLPELPAPHEPPVFGFTSADMRAYARAYAAQEVAAERERLARVVREFPNWLGPQAKRDLLAAMGLEA